ncbi:MAG: hypothetical protein DI556_16160 [Rhodovulum sulfidophilum]|uniref:17 kDa surface antigen n=1 Tax=Rhodovulum sulfidophilum TaxID=35806 RepID=A0A2W5N618_RHOSU|nr:MAG: hypothetical protein DI556_16160 [Rhodovulum sulfidophilum]
MRGIAVGLLIALGGLGMLSGCGDTRGERVVTGAAGGALAGQVIAGEPLAGAAVGGVVGAVR